MIYRISNRDDNKIEENQRKSYILQNKYSRDVYEWRNEIRNRQIRYTDTGVKEETEMGKGQGRVEPTIGFQRENRPKLVPHP